MALRLENHLTPYDLRLVQQMVPDFVPEQVFDIHAHLVHDVHFAPGTRLPYMHQGQVLDLESYFTAASRWLPGRHINGLFFGFPRIDNDRPGVNNWMSSELATPLGSGSLGLFLASPQDDPGKTAGEVRRLGMVGLKPYHVYADLPLTPQARIEDFTPEWMWELCHEIDGVLMLHIVRDRAIADADNIASLRRLCRAWPRCRLVLAHIARSFCYRHAWEGLESLHDLDNVWVDTSAITETETFRKAIEVLGAQRIMFGSDYPLSELRGKCTATGDRFHWAYSEHTGSDSAVEPPPVKDEMTLIGIESLLCLRDACEASSLSQSDINDIFHDNARRLLAPHMRTNVQPDGGPYQKEGARNMIHLCEMSKVSDPEGAERRALQFDLH